ncbi:hypothetical protein TOT_020000741 [Theileria orientalis strain Shintoku]|uniref:Uncharacterized protein n=1 Tax=Theileria orientalis strain Shintoku TaxID=869250 RepID=J4D806_THEOR|nr:hypothetical protein TOT_020000741 [Theileria orientalis strain Shintoku]PVC51243.1 hypothetical protein MACL_00001684 [Theileria orientalis]BAM40485.1 hypothetical protein TOT_020000741 [Theileria orientalis strain Shintoku]|eukprot:XP_009690786.1 hypothetical protein TOT_020000741 [Theileria orientalis strain Shintoku]
MDEWQQNMLYVDFDLYQRVFTCYSMKKNILMPHGNEIP